MKFVPLSLSRRLGSLCGAYLIIMTAYFWVGEHTASGLTHSLQTPLDTSISFAPAWVIVYAGIYLQALAPACVISEEGVMVRTIAGYLSLVATSVLIWLSYPVSIPRFHIQVTDVWTYGMAMVHKLDMPTNCFPSLHVSMATFAALVVCRHDRLIGRILIGTALLITWSTLTTKQHWAADGVSAIFFAQLADWFWLSGISPERLRPLPRKWHLLWLAIYGIAVLTLMSGYWLGWVPRDWLQQN